MPNETTIQHGTYGCAQGHTQKKSDIPNNHCDDCWNVFFFAHAEFTRALDDVMFEPNGEQIIEAVKGKKTLTQFKRFRATHELVRVNVEKETPVTAESITLDEAFEDGSIS